MNEKKPTFAGELQFAGYADSSRGGPRITLRLADRDELQKFIGQEGKRFMAVLMEIADDETPAATPAPEAASAKPRAQRERMAPLCEWAVFRCSEPDFQRWIRPIYDRAMGGDGTGWGDVTPEMDFRGNMEAYAAHCLKVLCDVRSRKDLDTNPAAAKRFHSLIRAPYATWLHEQQAVPA